MSTTTEMTREELEAALYIATENRRILAQAVLDYEDCFYRVTPEEMKEKYNRMLSLAEEMVK